KKLEHKKSTDAVIGEDEVENVESTVEVPYIDISAEIPQLHSYARIKSEQLKDTNIEKGVSKQKHRKFERVVQAVQIKQEAESSESDEVIITEVEPPFNETEKKHVPSSTHLRQKSINILTPSSFDNSSQMQVLADVHQSSNVPYDTLLLDHNYAPQNVIEISPVKTVSSYENTEVHTTKTEARRITDGDENAELDVFVPPQSVSQATMVYKPRERMKGKQVVTILQKPTNENIGGPVPFDLQLPGFFYCDKCPSYFKDKNYFRRHMTRLCKKLTNKKMLKCLYCGKLFGHENRYKDHLSRHDGKKRNKCLQCGETFAMQTQLTRHKKLKCLQRKK
ncbi:MAG: hypothetical protein MJE68_17460, partial [Proteobacteria bacterium]|nr:hypothetical protein [Pseudomonadota bacterium]